jgi:hypothetical protein
MAKNRHHYVPQFYLRNFSSSACGHDIINLYHIKYSLAKKDVAIKSQCYRWKFYGNTDELENKLAAHENSVAPLLRMIIRQSCLPQPASHDMKSLYNFGSSAKPVGNFGLVFRFLATCTSGF